MRVGHPCVWASLAMGLLVTFAGRCEAQYDFERSPINYQTAPADDPVAKLSDALADGSRSLTYEPRTGYLRSLLEALDIPVSSQTLVFSKTSLQLHRISPRSPRAIYFNDEVYVGFVQNGDVIELAASGPANGATFYTLSQDEPTGEGEATPAILRDRGQCVTCHASHRTQSVPGYLVRSVFPDRSGRPLIGSGTTVTDPSSPLRQRWGGWYVTGTHGAMRHRGNTISTARHERDFDYEAGANVASLADRFATSRYLSPHSDLVALMVLEHQSQMHNAIAAASYETRRALHQSNEMNAILDRPEGFVSPSARRRIDRVADNLVRHLLFADEYPLTDRVAGTTDFADTFAARGPSDERGRSLRQFDLSRRLFRYPCSYLIYSAAFTGLPDDVRTLALAKLDAALASDEQPAELAHLTAALRADIRSILAATLPGYDADVVAGRQLIGLATEH